MLVKRQQEEFGKDQERLFGFEQAASALENFQLAALDIELQNVDGLAVLTPKLVERDAVDLDGVDDALHAVVIVLITVFLAPHVAGHALTRGPHQCDCAGTLSKVERTSARLAPQRLRIIFLLAIGWLDQPGRARVGTAAAAMNSPSIWSTKARSRKSDVRKRPATAGCGVSAPKTWISNRRLPMAWRSSGSTSRPRISRPCVLAVAPNCPRLPTMTKGSVRSR